MKIGRRGKSMMRVQCGRTNATRGGTSRGAKKHLQTGFRSHSIAGVIEFDEPIRQEQ